MHWKSLRSSNVPNENIHSNRFYHIKIQLFSSFTKRWPRHKVLGVLHQTISIKPILVDRRWFDFKDHKSATTCSLVLTTYTSRAMKRIWNEYVIVEKVVACHFSLCGVNFWMKNRLWPILFLFVVSFMANVTIHTPKQM